MIRPTVLAGTVSVVIPAYNAGKTIGRALDSVLAQTRPPDEIIVINDGSTDSTEEIVRRNYPSVVLITQANSGPSAARNAGISASRGEYTAFLDADDRWLPEKIERQLEILARRPEIALLATQQIWLGDGEHPQPPSRISPHSFQLITFDRLLLNNAFATSSVIVRSDVLREIGGFDPSIRGSEDYDLWLRISYRYPAGILPVVLVEHYLNRESISQDIDRMITGELAAFARWAPVPNTQSTREECLDDYRYTYIMKWWRLKFAFRCYNRGLISKGRGYLRAAFRPLFPNPLASMVSMVGYLSPRAFLMMGRGRKNRLYGYMGYGNDIRKSADTP